MSSNEEDEEVRRVIDGKSDGQHFHGHNHGNEDLSEKKEKRDGAAHEEHGGDGYAETVVAVEPEPWRAQSPSRMAAVWGRFRDTLKDGKQGFKDTWKQSVGVVTGHSREEGLEDSAKGESKEDKEKKGGKEEKNGEDEEEDEQGKILSRSDGLSLSLSLSLSLLSIGLFIHLSLQSPDLHVISPLPVRSFTSPLTS